MSSNQKDETPPRRANPEQPLPGSDETVERDSMKGPVQPTVLEPGTRERPDLDWAEHED